MRFGCLGYLDETMWDAMSKGEQDAMIDECFAYDDMLRERGHWLDGGQALQTTRTAKTLRWNGDKVIVTDGPYAETKEQIGGLGVLDARDISEAVELMSKHPALRRGCPFEIRPVDEECNARWEARDTAAAAPTQLFVNLPVKDLNKSIAFFTQLGFQFNPQFTDDTATCMIVGENIFVMLLTEDKFQTFTPRVVCDAKQSTEVLVCLSRPSRTAVDDMVRKAVAAGGSAYAEPKDYGFMYQHGFQDPDGHLWELVYMNPADVPKQ